MRCGPKRLRRCQDGRLAVRRHEALGERDDRRARVQAARGQRGDDLVQAARGDAEEHEVELRQAGARGLDPQVGRQPRRPGGSARFSPSARRRSACSSVRVCSVVRRPPRASRTATAVPNEPAPTTTARRAPGRAKEGRGRSATRGTTRPPCRRFLPASAASTARRRVVTRDAADAAAAPRARAAQPDVRQVGLDAPASRPRASSSANGHCRSRWKMLPPGSASSRSSSTGVCASMHGTPSGVRSRQSSIGSASTLSSEASVRPTARSFAASWSRGEQPRGHVEREQRQRLHAALAQVRRDDRRVGERVAVDLQRRDVGDRAGRRPARTRRRTGSRAR